jgi:hypothetical protein
MKYLKQFVVGSCAFVVLPWFIFMNLTDKNKNYKYKDYVKIIPITTGLWNVLSLIISEYFGLSYRMRFIVITFINWITNNLSAYYNNYYDFTQKEWIQYYIYMFIKFSIVWNIIVYNIEKNFN